jgi:hypothetical protein
MIEAATSCRLTKRHSKKPRNTARARNYPGGELALAQN